MRLAGLFLVALLAQAESPIPAKLCDMMVRPAEYSGKLVSVRVEAMVGFETQELVDGACPRLRVWFEIDEEFIDASRRLNWMSNPVNLRKKIAVTLIGVFETGKCFGHQCFSRAQLRVRQFLNVSTMERRLAPDFSNYDCELLARDTKVIFTRGHMDQSPSEPVRLGTSNVFLVDKSDTPIVFGALLQIALTNTRLISLEPDKGGRFRLPSLAPGAYAFSAVATAFQSVSGCFVVIPRVSKAPPMRIPLPPGV